MGFLSLSVEATSSMINCCFVMGLSQVSQISPAGPPPESCHALYDAQGGLKDLVKIDHTCEWSWLLRPRDEKGWRATFLHDWDGAFADERDWHPVTSRSSKELYKADLVTREGKESSMFLAELGPGANMGKHYYPGDAFAYILEGTMLLEIAGKESVALKPGQSGSLPCTSPHPPADRMVEATPGCD